MALPSLLVMLRSAVAPSESVSVAELFVLVGSVMPVGAAMLAVFANVPLAPSLINPVSVKVAVPPTNKLTVVLMLPEPDAVQDEPDEATHVHVEPVIVAGNVSVTVAPVTGAGPVLVATIV